MLALAGLISIQSWLRSDDGRIGDSESQGQAEAAREQAEPVVPPRMLTRETVTEEAVAFAEPLPSAASMRAYLLITPQANRNRILGLAVTEKGYECSSVKSASLVGTSGSAWRAHCGDTLVYWVVVDEFSQFSVAPMPYGDLDPPTMADPEFLPVQPQSFEVQPVEPPETR